MTWAILTFVLVRRTKCSTWLKLRNLLDKLQSGQREAEDLYKHLSEVVNKESVLQDETEKLMNKANTLQNVVFNLKRSLERVDPA